jgi:rare lipoprotein A (peptidoglycan hydrolase)
MSARRIVMLLVACALAVPAVASADPAPDTGGTPAPAPDPALTVTPNVLIGAFASFSGSLPDDAGSTVTLQRFDEETETWIEVATAVVGDDGSYAARWRADVTGRLRTRVQRSAGAALAVTAQPAPEASMTVYRPAMASWYGPGFYGRPTACGQRMTRTLLGIAHRKLPCGTPVAVTYGGRSITVPVVDRGPFKPGRRWDLTAAAAQALGFTFTDRIGAVRLRGL